MSTTLSFIFRAVWMTLILSIGPVAIGAAFLGRSGAFGGLAFTILLFVAIATRAETFLIELFHASGSAAERENPSPLMDLLREHVVKELDRIFRKNRWSPKQNPPRIVFFADPAPAAYVARSWHGNGTLYLSAGLLATLEPKELEEFLKDSLEIINHPHLVLTSVCAVLACWCLWFSPGNWTRSLLGSEETLQAKGWDLFRPLMFVLFFAVSRTWLYIGGTVRPSRLQTEGNAANQIRKKLLLWPPILPHGTEALQLFPFHNRRAILSLLSSGSI